MIYSIRVETVINGEQTVTTLRYGGILSAGIVTYTTESGARINAVGFDFAKWNIRANFRHAGLQQTIGLLEVAMTECGGSDDPLDRN